MISALLSGLSGRLRGSWLPQLALHLLALGVALALPHASRAQDVNIVSVAGGSSALLGNFTTGNFRQGAVPQIIEDSQFAITGYRPAGVSDNGVVVATSVVVSDPNGVLETVNDAMIRWYKPNANTINVIILLRSDSGNGVRYVANYARITEWTGVFRQRSSTGQFVDPTGDAFAVVNAVIEKAGFSHRYEDSQLPIATGYSDVTADTVVRYANFPNLWVPGLRNIISVQGPIQTMLLAYNKDGVYGKSGPKEVQFPRVVVQMLLNTDLSGLNMRWSDWDPALSDNVIFANRRENSSGTRLTEYTGIQRYLWMSPTVRRPGNRYFFIEDDLPDSRVRRGTGAMLTAVNGGTSNFGYAYVTGTAGNNLPNIRVGGYWDSDSNLSHPYANLSASDDLPLPNNNGQPAYGTGAYYNIRMPGSYPLWSYANSFSRPEEEYRSSVLAQADIFAALSASPQIVHREGLILPEEMLVERNFFVSSITGEIVTDGQRIVRRGKARRVGEPGNDDPQH